MSFASVIRKKVPGTFSALKSAWHFHLLALLLVYLPALRGWAQTIKLTDKSTLEADVVQSDDNDVYLRVSRDRIASIDGKPLPPVLVAGVVAPAFTVKDLSGVLQTVGPKNDYVTLLHFWVHWCPHCRSDAPKIQELYDKFRGNPKVRIVAVNLDQDRSKLDQFLKERNVTYPVIVAAESASAPDGVNIPELYQIHSFPITFLIDAKGVIQRKINGSFVESGVDMSALIASLVPEPEKKTQDLPRRSTRKVAQLERH